MKWHIPDQSDYFVIDREQELRIKRRFQFIDVITECRATVASVKLNSLHRLRDELFQDKSTKEQRFH